MRRLILAAFAACAFICPAVAQQSWTHPGPPTGIAYPINSTPITISATGTTAAVTATLPANANQTTYICGFVITSGGTTAALVGNATVTGTIGGTLNFSYVDVSSGQGVLGIPFPQCIPASANGQTIAVTAPAGGAGTVAAVTAWGYQL